MTAQEGNNEIFVRLVDVFRAVFADEGIDLREEMTADDIEEWDSIAHVSLIFAVEEEFGVSLSTDDLEGIANVGDLRVAVERHLDTR